MNLQIVVAKMCIEHGTTQVIEAVNAFRERVSVFLAGMIAEDSVPASVRAAETRNDAPKPVKLQGRVKSSAPTPKVEKTGETKAKRVLSEEARQRIVEAQKRRHAKAKAAKAKAERQARTGISAAVKVTPVDPVEAVPEVPNGLIDPPVAAGEVETSHAIMAE